MSLTAPRRPGLTFLLALVLSLAVGAVHAHAAQAATLTITPGADPARDKSLNISISGSTEVNRNLYAYVYQGTPLCPALASSNSGTNLTPLGGSFEFAGPVSHSYSYTPTATGRTPSAGISRRRALPLRQPRRRRPSACAPPRRR